MFHRWRRPLFWVLLVYGLVAAVWTTARGIEYLARGMVAFEAVDLLFRIGSTVIVLWTAWSVVRRRSA